MAEPQVRYEAGQTSRPFEVLSSEDNKVFAASFRPWSDVTGFAPVVAPNGLMTGGAITPDTGSDAVKVAALTARMAGVDGADANGVLAVAQATGLTITRGTAPSDHVINSITIDGLGDVVVVDGTPGASFAEARGTAGGPPYIPVDSIEIGQVRVSSETSAPITASEILAVPGLHVERADFPVWQTDFGRGQIEFAEALPLIHTGDEPKEVWLRAATPLFAPIPNTSDWTPAESTYTINSTDTYDGPVGSASSSLNQASFTAVLKDGITDAFVSSKGKNLWFEFRPDRDKTTPRQLTQGILGISRSFPAGGGNFTASCTVTPRSETVDETE